MRRETAKVSKALKISTSSNEIMLPDYKDISDETLNNNNEDCSTICYPRNCGIIEGNFSRLVPFFYILQPGRFEPNIQTVHDRLNGIFGVHNRNKYEASYYSGMILPLATCRNRKIKAAVAELKKQVFSREIKTDKAKLGQKAQLIISEAFGNNVMDECRSRFPKSIGFETNSEMFKMLSDNFEYLDEIQDCSGGAAVPTKYKPLGVETYGNFMEQYNAKTENHHWNHFRIDLVFQATGDIDGCYELHFVNDSISRPKNNLLKNFVISSNAVNCSPLCISLEQNKQSILIHMALGSNRLSTSFWNEINRLEPLIAWLKCIDHDDMPVSVDAGNICYRPHIKMTAYPTNEKGRILVHMSGSDGEQFNEIVSKGEFLTSFKAAISKFFLNGFDAKAWYCMHKGVLMPDRICRVPEPHIGEIITSDPWFMK